ncbi:MAG: septum formation initiator family protein [Pyrinomonadaceae bacterium]
MVTFMLCLAINFRAFSEMRKQTNEFSELNTEIDNISDKNLALQEEIQNLKKDEATIAREARKLGLSRPNEKVLVPSN